MPINAAPPRGRATSANHPPQHHQHRPSTPHPIPSPSTTQHFQHFHHPHPHPPPPTTTNPSPVTRHTLLPPPPFPRNTPFADACAALAFANAQAVRDAVAELLPPPAPSPWTAAAQALGADGVERRADAVRGYYAALRRAGRGRGERPREEEEGVVGLRAATPPGEYGGLVGGDWVLFEGVGLPGLQAGDFWEGLGEEEGGMELEQLGDEWDGGEVEQGEGQQGEVHREEVHQEVIQQEEVRQEWVQQEGVYREKVHQMFPEQLEARQPVNQQDQGYRQHAWPGPPAEYQSIYGWTVMQQQQQQQFR
ncbi:hypothetical protein NpPPO83_00004342 [Neofusicoccum parvum]|uniref:Uncharacterized protein n=1 Tax=Neofusicoccum parvum TaxID=310453 RepID=A0ACB5SCJ9_9PEZI|nr:hypothetical protein NpPPO83_00004342 [Neofusicoccum parvum]